MSVAAFGHVIGRSGAPVGPLRLVATDLGDLELTPEAGYIVQDYDLGSPAVRATASDRTAASGTSDSTVLTGARAVTLTVGVHEPDDPAPGEPTTQGGALARLRAYADPARRPWLVYAEDDGTLRRVVLRADGYSWRPAGGDEVVSVQLSWKAPSGLLEDAEASVAIVTAAQAAQPGITYPRRYPRRYPRTSVVGAAYVLAGPAWSAAIDHVTQLWGPCTSPRLLNLTTGAVLSLPGLVLSAEQYAEVDTAAATIRLNGRPAESLYAWQQWGISSFWRLAGGTNLLRYSPQAFDGAARAVLTYRPATL